MQSLEDRTLLSVPQFDHIVVVVEENKSPMNVIGNSGAPYINSLAQNGAYLSKSFGNFRPSQPNYFALFSGSGQGVKTNDDVNLGNIPNLASQLIGAGKTFVGYAEGLPSVGYTGTTSGRYARKHNPVVSFSNIPASSNRPYTDFPSNYSSLPAVSLVIPNLDDDSHDGTLAESDKWLKNNMSAYAEWAKTHNSLLIVTYDEGDLSDTTNHIPTIFYGANVRPGNYANQITHYNVLRTIEESEGLSAIANAQAADPIDYIFTNTAPPSLATPTNLVANVISGTQINITWTDNADNETGYKIERATDGVHFSILSGTGVNGHGYNNTNLTPGKQYSYRVYAINANGKSAYSNVASGITGTGGTTTTPATPTNLGASATGTSSIHISWSDNANNETGYRLERSSDGTNFSFLTNLGANATSYDNGNLSPNTRYYYRVQAAGSPNSSGYSNIGSATTQSTNSSGAPATPTNLTARGSTSVANAIDLSWSDNASNETGYKIERSTDGKTFYPLAGTGPNGTFNRNTNLTPGRLYYYRAYAINGSGASGYSNVVSATTTSSGGTVVTPPPPPPSSAGVPAAPTSLTVKISGSVANAIDLSWIDHATDETGYKIERSTDGKNFYALAGGGPNTTFHRNTGVVAGKRYYYRVYAANGFGNSPFSNVASLVF
jgi:fibronectin type 3 domain-containing protein